MTRIFAAAALLLSIVSAAVAQLVFEPQLARDIVFPDTPVDASSDLNYTATSRGQGPWNVRLNTNNQRFSIVPNQFVVQNGQAVRFTLRFSPQQQGVVNGLLSGNYDNGQGMVRINSNLVGRGVPAGPLIDVDPDTLDLYVYTDEFGTIWNVTELPVTISNTGNADLNIQSISDPVDWLVSNRNAFSVRAGESAEVILSTPQEEWEQLAPDFYETTVTVTSNAVNQQRLTIPIYFYRGFVPHFLVVLSDPLPEAEHAIVVDEATIDGESLVEWDEVGALTPRGDLAGSGVLEVDWPIAMLAWGDNPEAGFAGFRQGEAFDFRLWDASAGREFHAEAEFTDGDESFAAGGASAVNLTAEPDLVEQVIPLRQGWSSISLRVRPEEQYWTRQEGPDVIRLFASIVGNVNMVKDGYGQFYLPSRQFNSIPYIRLDRGLQVRMGRADTLRIRGVPIPPDQQISLARGWNLAPYYPTDVLSMATAYADLSGSNLLVMAKDAFGRFYLPRINFGGENPIALNSAVQVNVTEACSFRYPANRFASKANPGFTDDDSTVHFPQPEPTDGNMSILINAIDGVEVHRNAELACLTPGGRIAGAVRLNGPPPWGMPVWGDDSFTEDVIEGFRDGEQLRFVFYDGYHVWWELDATFDVIEGGAPVYRENHLLIIGAHVGVVSDDPSLPTELALAKPYPNPFNASVRLSFDLPEPAMVRLTLTDLNGREQLTVASGWFEAGTFERSADASSLPAGVYLAVLDAEGRQFTQRVVLLK